MAISLEELRRQANAQNTQHSAAKPTMTLEQLRRQAGTTAPQTKTAEANASAVSVNNDVVLPVEKEKKQEDKGFWGNLKDTAGAFWESGVQGVGNAFSNLESTHDTMKAYTAAPGAVYDEIQDTFYDVNKAGQVADIVKRNQEQYGRDSEYVQDIQQDIMDRQAVQAQKLADIQEKYRDAKYGNMAITAGSGIGNLIPSMAMGAVTGVGGAGTALFGANVFGGAMGEALNSGATLEQATGYAAADAAMETGIEMLFGGIPALGKGLLGKTIKEKAEDLTMKYIKTAAGQLLVNRLMDITGEGVEEAVSAYVEPFLRRAFFDKDAENAKLSDLATAFGGGVLVSAILGIANFGGNVQEYRAIKKKIAQNKAQSTDAAPAGTENAENAAEMMPPQENVADMQQSAEQQTDEEAGVQEQAEKQVQRATDNLQIVQELEAQGIDTGNAVQELTEAITGEKAKPAADPKVVEKENARMAAIEESARQGIATAEDVEKVKTAAAENIRQSENKVVATQKFGDEEINRIEDLAKDKGYNVVYESDDSENAPNGYIKDNTIYINLAGDSPYFNVAVHEVLHGLKGNTKLWNRLEKSVFDMIGSDPDMTQFADAVVAKYTEDTNSVYYKSLLTDGKLDGTKLNEEVVANFVEEYLPKIAGNDAQLMEKIKKDRNLIDGLLDIIRGIKNNLAIKYAKSEKAMLDEAERNMVNLLRAESQVQKEARYTLKTDNKGGKYWEIETGKDIFKNIKATADLKKAAFSYLLNGYKQPTVSVDMGGYTLDFVRIGAKEFVYSAANKGLNGPEYRQKMRMAPSVLDLIENSNTSWESPDHKSHKIAKDGWINYRGKVKIDNTFFTYVVRVAKSEDRRTFYDINIEVDSKVPGANKHVSHVKMSTSNNNIPLTVNNSNGKKQSGNSGMYSAPVSQYDGENSKSRNVRRHAVHEFADSLGGMFGITGRIGKEGLRKEAYKIADKVEEKGWISEADKYNFFDAAYRAARVTDEKADYAPLKKRIRETGIEPLGGSEYVKFAKKYFGKVKFKRGGLPIDTLYQELAGKYPEYINPDITNQYDQMWHLGQVYDSLQRKEMSLDEYYGDYAQEFRDESYASYSRQVDLFVERINSISRYKKANVDRKAAKDRAQGQPERVYTLEDVKKAYKKAEQINKEIRKLMANTALREEDKVLLDDLLKIKNQSVLANTLQEMQENNENAKFIYKLYNLKQELANVREPARAFSRAAKEGKRAEFMDLLTTSKSWKEKHKFGGLRYEMETFERIIDDIVTDKKAAERLKDMLPRSIHRHVAESNRYKNELRDRVRRLNLDRKKLYDVEFENKNNQLITGQITESGLVQVYGEGLITEEYLDKIGADTEKITAAAEEFRKIYNELIEKINDAYIRNGYKPIEYRGDYFPHFMEDGTDTLLNKMTSFLGVDVMSKIPVNWRQGLARLTVKDYTDNGMLPTEIAGKTYQFSPGRRWNSHAMERVGENTVYDSLKGFDNYLETAADVIFLTDDIQNLRSFEDSIRYKFSDKGIQKEIDAIDEMEELTAEEKWLRKKDIYGDENKNKYLNHFVGWLHNYTNLLAGKKDLSDRTWEQKLGRGIYRLSKDMESRVAANMVAGNISSAMTNFIPIAQMTAQVKEKYILTAMGDTVKHMLKENDGFNYGSDFLTNRKGSERLVNDTIAGKLQDMRGVGQLLAIMETVDEFTSNVVVRAKYMQNTNDGMSHEEAIRDADEFAAGLMADRSKGALPTIFETKNPLAKAMTMFQVEQNNQMQYLLKDLPRSLGDKEELGKLLTMALFKYSLYSWLYNWMHEKIAGRKPSFSPIDLVADTGRRFYNVSTGDMDLSEAVSDTVVSVAEELPFAAAPLAMSGLSDDAGRLPISGALPDISNVLKLFDSEISLEKKKSIRYKEMSKPIFYLLFSVAGGQIKKTGEALWQMGVNDGVSYYTNNNGSKSVQFVTDTSNPLKWAQSAAFGRWSTSEARDYVDGGFNYLNKVENGMYNYLTELGFSSKEAYAQVAGAKKKADTDGNKSLKTSEVVRYLDKTGMSRQDKANLFEIMLPDRKDNPYK